MALGILREVDAPGGGRTHIRAFPARFSRLKPGLEGPAPRLGEHTAVVAAEAGISAAGIARMLEETALGMDKS